MKTELKWVEPHEGHFHANIDDRSEYRVHAVSTAASAPNGSTTASCTTISAGDRRRGSAGDLPGPAYAGDAARGVGDVHAENDRRVE
ncbi:hypothetical protein L843_5549 [Mycobacterium intracellulare MIN_061107_1834]|nr:hypothetical protein L843_5549 [Mycobacterium intracellulare MIN_061107_1834]